MWRRAPGDTEGHRHSPGRSCACALRPGTGRGRLLLGSPGASGAVRRGQPATGILGGTEGESRPWGPASHEGVSGTHTRSQSWERSLAMSWIAELRGSGGRAEQGTRQPQRGKRPSLSQTGAAARPAPGTDRGAGLRAVSCPSRRGRPLPACALCPPLGTPPPTHLPPAWSTQRLPDTATATGGTGHRLSPSPDARVTPGPGSLRSWCGGTRGTGTRGPASECRPPRSPQSSKLSRTPVLMPPPPPHTFS